MTAARGIDELVRQELARVVPPDEPRPRRGTRASALRYGLMGESVLMGASTDALTPPEDVMR
jgi:hypothetical protein